jgi:hypothetical protein
VHEPRKRKRIITDVPRELRKAIKLLYGLMSHGDNTIRLIAEKQLHQLEKTLWDYGYSITEDHKKLVLDLEAIEDD